MVNRKDLENRLMPYKMLLKGTETMYELETRILPENAIPSLVYCFEGLISHYKDCIEKAGEGLPIVGHHFSFPTEFLYAFDCVPVCIESVSFMLSALLPNTVEKYFDLINNYGHPYHTCSAQKGIMGMSLDNLTYFDAIVTATSPCDNTMASYPFFELRKNYPLVVADMPFYQNDESYTYFGGEIQRALEKIGKIIDQEPDYKRLKKHLQLENRINQTMLDIFELKKAIPCPVSNIYNGFSSAVQIFLSGKQEKAYYYDKVLQISKERLKEGIHHGGEEKIRSIWPYMLVFFSMELCEWLDRYLGMSVLFDVFNYGFTENIRTDKGLDAMFFDMAKKTMNVPMVKQSANFYQPFIEEMVYLAKEFSANCFIYTSSIACKQFGSVPQLLKEAIKEELGIPQLLIDIDVADPRITNVETIKEKVKMFIQTLM
ncbi:MAG: 2-hydroxyacyl-CoA dehydratase [Promethearchaeota archaeon]